MAFDLSRLRNDQLLRLEEVGGDLSQLTDDELLDLESSQEEIGDFGAGFKAAGAALDTGLAGLAQSLGFDETAQASIDAAQRSQEELARRYERDVPSIVDAFEQQGILGGISDLPEYLKETLAFSLPQTGAALGAGAAGTVIGGPGLGAAAAVAVGTPLFAGYNIQRQMEEQGIGLEDAQIAKAYGVGVGQAALDAILGRVLGVFGRTQGPEELAKAAQRGMVNRIARAGGKGALIEAPTEVAQQALEIIQANPEKFYEFGEEVQRELLESAIAGGLLGGTISAPTGIIKPQDPNKEKENDLDRHMQEEALEAAQMAENARFMAGEQKLLEQQPEVLGLPAPEPISVSPEGEAVVPETSALRTPRGRQEPVIRQPAVGEMPVDETRALPKPGDVAFQIPEGGYKAPKGPGIVERIREGAITDPTIMEAAEILGLPAPKDVAFQLPQGTPREPGVQEVIREGAVTQPAIGEMPVEPTPEKSAVEQFLDNLTPADLKRMELEVTPRLPSPETVTQDVIGVPPGGFREPGPIELTPDSAITQPSIERAGDRAKAVLGIQPLNDPRVQETIEKLADEKTTKAEAKNLRAKLRRILRQIGVSETRVNRITAASVKGLDAARKFSKKAQAENDNIIRENAKKFATDSQRSQFNRLAERVRKTLIKRLRALGLSDVAVDFDSGIAEDGSVIEGYQTRDAAGKILIALAHQIYSPDITEEEMAKRLGEVMNHEMIHAIRELGLFTEQEYQTLVSAAKNQKFVDRKGQTRTFSYFERANRLYEGSSQEVKEEEAVAELFRDWAAGRKKIGGKPRSLFKRIVDFLFGAAKEVDAEGIFKKIESGEIGGRDRSPITRAREEPMMSIRKRGNKPAFYSVTSDQLDRLLERYDYVDGTIGFALRMPIEDFMSLTYGQGEIDKQNIVSAAKEFLNYMPSNDGSKFVLNQKKDRYAMFDPEVVDTQNRYAAVPYLELKEVDGVLKVTNHEGRHRTALAAIDGANTIPVRVLYEKPYREWNAARFTREEGDPPVGKFDYRTLTQPITVEQQYAGTLVGEPGVGDAFFTKTLTGGVPISYMFKTELSNLIGPNSDYLRGPLVGLPNDTKGTKKFSRKGAKSEYEQMMEWLSESVIQDDVYHATLEDFPAFDMKFGDIGMHFGTNEQAMDRLEETTRHLVRYYINNEEPARVIYPRVISAKVNMKRPVSIAVDPRDWRDPDAVIRSIKAGARDPLNNQLDVSRKILNRVKGKPTLDKIRTAIRNEGFDSIVYINAVEGFGGGFGFNPQNLSYIVLDTEQIYVIDSESLPFDAIENLGDKYPDLRPESRMDEEERENVIREMADIQRQVDALEPSIMGEMDSYEEIVAFERGMGIDEDEITTPEEYASNQRQLRDRRNEWNYWIKRTDLPEDEIDGFTSLRDVIEFGTDPIIQDFARKRYRYYKLKNQLRDDDAIIDAMKPKTAEAVAEPVGITDVAGEIARLDAELDKMMMSRKGPRIMKNGEIVGAPPGARTVKDRDNLVRRMVRYMEHPFAMADKSKDWYERSGKTIREITRGDPKLMEDVARLMALYSQANSVGGNTTAIIKSIYQLASGQDTAFAGRFPATTAKRIPELLAAESFDQSVPGVSDKLENFYRNLIDPAKGTDTFDDASTMDKWMMRLFDYKVADDEEVGGASALSPTQYEYAKDIVRRMGDSYGRKTGQKLLPRQTQAILWTYIKNKAAYDSIKDPKKKDQFQPQTLDFNDYVTRATAHVTWESRPSESVPLLPWIHDAPRNVQEMWNQRVRDILTNPDGSDKIMELFPSQQLYNSSISTGAYEGRVTPNVISRIVLRKDDEGYVDDVATQVAAIIGYVTKQDAVPWYRPDVKGGKFDSMGFDVQVDQELTPELENRLITHLDALIPGIGYTKVDGSLQFINWRDENGKPEMPDQAFRKRLVDALESFPDEITFIQTPFRAQSQYIANDWEENPNGEGYIQTIGEQRFADIQETVDGWADSYVQAANEFDSRRSELIGDRGSVVPDADQQARDGGDATRFSRRGYPQYDSGRLGPEKGRDEFDGYHYSATDGLSSLDSEFHGSGKAGLELRRGWRGRVFFYLQQEEELPRPELQLRNLQNGYGAFLPNIYNPRKDRYIIDAVKKINNGVLNHDMFEDMVESEGYDGYMNWGFQPTPAMVLLNKNVVPVKQTMSGGKRFSKKGAFAPSANYERIMSRVIYEEQSEGPINKILGKIVGQVEGETLGQAFVRNTVNRFLPGFILDNVAYGSMVNDSNSVGKAMELSQQMSGRMEALIQIGALKINSDTGDISLVEASDNKGIQEIFAPIGEEKKKAFQAYAVARREADLRKKGRRGFLNLSNADVQKLLSEAPQEFKDVFEEYSIFNRRMVQFAVDSGLITQEMADNLTEMAYVPFYRKMESDAVNDLGKALGKNAGNSLNNPSVFDKELEGGKIPLGDFYENIIRNNEMILSASLRNIAMRKTADALDRMNALGITSHGKKLNKKSEGERVLVFRRDGEEQYYQIDDAALWVSIANLTPTQRNAITAFMEIFAGILRSGVTLSPGFMIANLWRGKIDAYVKAGVPLNPITTTIRGMRDAYTGGESATAIKIKTGIGGYTYGIGQEAFAKELRRKYRMKEGGYGPLQRFGDGLAQAKYHLEKVGEATELAERIALFEKIKATGVSEREAAYQAMNLINFGRRGAGGGILGSSVLALVPMIPFLNARIQGLYRLIEDPNQQQDVRVKMTKEVALRGMLVGAASTALYAAMSDDDRWDEERLDRKLNYDIWYAGDYTIYLPRAFEIGSIFGTLPMLTLEAIRKEDGKDLAQGAASIFLNTFAFNPIPQGMMPIIEVVANHDFFRGAPIEGMGLQRLPQELRYYDTTPDFYKMFGQTLGVSPLKTQQLFEGYTGNMGAGFIGFLDMLMGTAGVIPDRPSGVFGDPHSLVGTVAGASGISRFVAEDGQRSARFVTDFYEIKRNIEEVYYAIKEASLRGDTEEINRLMQESGVALQYRKQFNRVADRITEINNELKRISMAPNISSEEKSSRMKELRKMKNDLTRQYVKAAEVAGLY